MQQGMVQVLIQVVKVPQVLIQVVKVIRFRFSYLFCTNKISNKTDNILTKTLNKINIVVTGSCKGPLGHQVKRNTSSSK